MNPGGCGNMWCSMAVEWVWDLNVLYWIGRNRASAECRISRTASHPGTEIIGHGLNAITPAKSLFIKVLNS